MGDFPAYSPLELHAGGAISTTAAMVGLSKSIGASTAWPAANLAIFVPVRVPVPVTVYKMGIGSGATATGNFDVGIYDAAGNRLVSSGATAKGNSVEHIIDVTDTQIGPGVYYLAVAADGTNNYIMHAPTSLQVTRLIGVVQAASSYVLPATATFAACTNAAFPAISAWVRLN